MERQLSGPWPAAWLIRADSGSVWLEDSWIGLNLTDGVISSGESRGWAWSGRGAQRPASAFQWTPTMTQEQKIIRAKVGLLELAKQLGNVSQACKMMGSSRDSVSRFKELYDTGGELALQELTRRKPLLANRTAPEIEAAILALSLEQPAFGQIRVANEMRKQGRSISPAGVRGVWQRHDLETMKNASRRWRRRCPGGFGPDRRPACRAGEGQGGQGSPRRVRERVPGLLRRPGHVLRRHPEGGRRIYQQTFIDTSSKVALAKLSDRKTPLTAADLLNDRVVPFFDAHEVKLSRMLTDRGTEYCGTPERHEYELYLAVEDVDHSRTKTKSPQTADVIDKSFLCGSAVSFCRARVTAWRRAGPEVQALPRSPYRRSSVAAPVRAFGPRGFQPATKRA